QTVKIVTDPTIPGSMSPPRRYNFYVIEKHKGKLESLENSGCTLLSRGVMFSWLPVHARAFQELKDRVCQAPSLRPFNSSKPLLVQADASQTANPVLEECREQTLKDKDLTAVMKYQNGWPTEKRKADPAARQYWNLKNDLFTEQGLVILDNKIIIPESMRPKVLRQLHSGHLGMEKN
ncbi:hypothetical protein KUF71_008860, partial [Frankliniella fusca]